MKSAIEPTHVVEWRELWAEVLRATDAPEMQWPLHALCWCVEQLFLLGFEEARVLLFVQIVWRKFRAELGPPTSEHPMDVDPKPAPRPDEAPGGRKKSQAEWSDAAQQYEAELARMAAAELEGYRRFCALVEAARERFGDDRAWLTNVLGWALHALFRRGYRDAELGELVRQTWAVMSQAAQQRDPPLPPAKRAQAREIATPSPPRRGGRFT